MYLRECKYCGVVYKTVLKYSECCETCKNKNRIKVTEEKIKNRSKYKKEKDKTNKSIENMKEVIKDDPFLMLRM